MLAGSAGACLLGGGLSNHCESVPEPSPAHPAAPRLLSKILSECEDADEIEFLAEGSWRPIRAEKEPSCSPQGPILVLGEFCTPHPPAGAARPLG